MNAPIRRDPPPFMFAVEAVVGLTAQGKAVTEEAVRAWLEVALEGNQERIAPALFHARRMISGPVAEGLDPRKVAATAG